MNAQNTEKINEFGIMENSELKIILIEGQDIYENEALRRTGNPVSQISFQGQIVESRDVMKSESPVWNEEFIFNVTQPKGDILVNIFSKKKEYEFMGRFNIPIEELKDQKVKEKWFPLQGKIENVVKEGKILLKMQWIHSKVLLIFLM